MRLDAALLQLLRSMLSSDAEHAHDTDLGVTVRVVELPQAAEDAGQLLALGLDSLGQMNAMHFTLRVIWVPYVFREEPAESRRFFLISELEG